MFGAFVRGGIGLGVAVVVGEILAFIIPFLLPYQGPEDSLFYRSLDALAEWGTFLLIAAVLAALLARAVVEGGGPGGVPR